MTFYKSHIHLPVKILSFWGIILIFYAYAPQSTPGGNDKKPPATTAVALTEKQMADYPYWIKMMDDTNANFNDAEKAFYIYWLHRQKPVNDDNEGIETEKDEASANPNIQYTYEYKRFRAWEQYVRNYVMADGRIMPPHQRIQMWKKLQNQNQK